MRKDKHCLRIPLNFYSVHLLHGLEVLAPIDSSATISSPPTAFYASQQGPTSPASWRLTGVQESWNTWSNKYPKHNPRWSWESSGRHDKSHKLHRSHRQPSCAGTPNMEARYSPRRRGQYGEGAHFSERNRGRGIVHVFFQELLKRRMEHYSSAVATLSSGLHHSIVHEDIKTWPWRTAITTNVLLTLGLLGLWQL